MTALPAKEKEVDTSSGHIGSGRKFSRAPLRQGMSERPGTSERGAATTLVLMDRRLRSMEASICSLTDAFKALDARLTGPHAAAAGGGIARYPDAQLPTRTVEEEVEREQLEASAGLAAEAEEAQQRRRGSRLPAMSALVKAAMGQAKGKAGADAGADAGAGAGAGAADAAPRRRGSRLSNMSALVKAAIWQAKGTPVDGPTTSAAAAAAGESGKPHDVHEASRQLSVSRAVHEDRRSASALASPYIELGSLDLFGDLYEGGHAGHTKSGVPNEIPRGILLPWSRFLLSWDLLCSTMLMTLAFYLPFRLCFIPQAHLSWPADAWLLCIDVVCILDMFVGMCTAHYDYLGNLEVRASRPARRPRPRARAGRTPAQ